MTTTLPHILIVDDDQEIRELVASHLRKNGFKVDVAANGIEMRNLLRTARVDLIVLDRVMPGENGLTLCQEVRGTSSTPVILLTLLGSEMDRIVGLEVGADDYIAKPFNPQELVARIRAVLRRANALPSSARHGQENVLNFAGWTLNSKIRRLTSPERVVVTLTDGEFDLLHALAERPGIILSRDQLRELTAGRQLGIFDRGIDMQIARLRRKLSAHADVAEIIKTVRQRGYVFVADVEKTSA